MCREVVQVGCRESRELPRPSPLHNACATTTKVLRAIMPQPQGKGTPQSSSLVRRLAIEIDQLFNDIVRILSDLYFALTSLLHLHNKQRPSLPNLLTFHLRALNSS